MCGTYNGLQNLDNPAETHKIDNVTYWFSIIVPFTVGQEVRSQRFEGPQQLQAQFLDSLTTVITSVL